VRLGARAASAGPDSPYRETAHDYCQEKLLPRVSQAYQNERESLAPAWHRVMLTLPPDFDPAILSEMVCRSEPTSLEYAHPHQGRIGLVGRDYRGLWLCRRLERRLWPDREGGREVRRPSCAVTALSRLQGRQRLPIGHERAVITGHAPYQCVGRAGEGMRLIA
jgi:hypothetical protein